MADVEVNKTAWGLIEWSMTAGLGFVTFAVGYLALFLGKKWNKDIDYKITKYDINETKFRNLREANYEIAFNNLNDKAEGLIDKLEGLESELRERDGILDRLKDAENDINNLKGK